MHRVMVTLVTVGCLSGAYQVYSAYLLPLTEVRPAPQLQALAEDTNVRPPAQFEQQAREFFPDAEWTRQAEQTWQIAEHALLYFRHHEREAGTGNTVRMSPLALLWHDSRHPGGKPYRILAETARLKFENAFFDTAVALSNADPGRVVWASLEGSVHIDGPDGLVIDGRNFFFSEESTQLYSDYPIAFQYGPTPQDQMTFSGTADQVKVTFVPSPEAALGKDMPRVSGLAQLLLRRNVQLDIAFSQGGLDRKAHLTSAGSFEYDVLKREATFDNLVHVTQQTRSNAAGTGGGQDTLDCEWLALQFDEQNAAQSDTAAAGPGFMAGLVFRRMRALGSLGGRGSRLKVTSTGQELNAEMQDLMYDVVKRRAVMIDQERVVITKGPARFTCPRIGLQHTPDQQLELLECSGAGQMELTDDRFGDEPLWVHWSGSVDVHPAPEIQGHSVRIDREAQLSIPRQFGVAADVLLLGVDLRRARESGAGHDPLSRPLALKRARAEGHVRLASERLYVERADVVDAVIEPGQVVAQPGKTQKSSSADAEQGGTAFNPWIVEADQLKVKLIHDPLAAQIDVRTVNGVGHVQVHYDPGQEMTVGSTKMNGPLILKGASLQAANEGGVRQAVSLRGEPGDGDDQQRWATVSLGTTQLWGEEISLTRHENRVDVPGPGKLRLPVPRGLDGTPLTKPVMLDIVWGEKMAFDGRAARFFGAVTASVPGDQQSLSRLRCEELIAELNQRLSFADPQSRPSDVNLEVIEGRHNVQVEAYEYRGTSLIAVRRGELAQFRLAQTSGDFTGQGPGTISSWTLGNGLKMSPNDVAQANRPAKPATAAARWQFSNVRFEGQIQGNVKRSEATLTDRVQVLTAPVNEALLKFQRSQLSEQTAEAENAVWLGCEQLRIVQRQYDGQARKYSELFASGGAELEGHVFRAGADELTFDERREQFILRGLGHEARLFYQPEPRTPASTSTARLIEFVPSKRRITIDGSTGLSGSF